MNRMNAIDRISSSLLSPVSWLPIQDWAQRIALKGKPQILRIRTTVGAGAALTATLTVDRREVMEVHAFGFGDMLTGVFSGSVVIDALPILSNTTIDFNLFQLPQPVHAFDSFKAIVTNTSASAEVFDLTVSVIRYDRILFQKEVRSVTNSIERFNTVLRCQQGQAGLGQEQTQEKEGGELLPFHTVSPRMPVFPIGLLTQNRQLARILGPQNRAERFSVDLFTARAAFTSLTKTGDRLVLLKTNGIWTARLQFADATTLDLNQDEFFEQNVVFTNLLIQNASQGAAAGEVFIDFVRYFRVF